MSEHVSLCVIQSPGDSVIQSLSQLSLKWITIKTFRAYGFRSFWPSALVLSLIVPKTSAFRLKSSVMFSTEIRKRGKPLFFGPSTKKPHLKTVYYWKYWKRELYPKCGENWTFYCSPINLLLFHIVPQKKEPHAYNQFTPQSQKYNSAI